RDWRRRNSSSRAVEARVTMRPAFSRRKTLDAGRAAGRNRRQAVAKFIVECDQSHFNRIVRNQIKSRCRLDEKPRRGAEIGERAGLACIRHFVWYRGMV